MQSTIFLFAKFFNFLAIQRMLKIHVSQRQCSGDSFQVDLCDLVKCLRKIISLFLKISRY